jgi:hypothetical protein
MCALLVSSVSNHLGKPKHHDHDRSFHRPTRITPTRNLMDLHEAATRFIHILFTWFYFLARSSISIAVLLPFFVYVFFSSNFSTLSIVQFSVACHVRLGF